MAVAISEEGKILGCYIETASRRQTGAKFILSGWRGGLVGHFGAHFFGFGAVAFGGDEVGFGAARAAGFLATFAGGVGKDGEFFLVVCLGDFFGEALAGACAISGLRARVGNGDGESGGDMAECDGGRDLVDVLAAGAAGSAEDFEDVTLAENHYDPASWVLVISLGGRLRGSGTSIRGLRV